MAYDHNMDISQYIQVGSHKILNKIQQLANHNLKFHQLCHVVSSITSLSLLSHKHAKRSEFCKRIHHTNDVAYCCVLRSNI